MMKSKKMYVWIVAIFVLIGGGVYGVTVATNNRPVDTDKLPINRIHASYIYDVSDKRANVAWSDYVFVGKVLSNKGTIYNSPGGSKAPFTQYTVEVIENMKGKLKKKFPLPITKDGGVTKDRNYVVLYEDDVLPVVGKQYIFLAVAGIDGALLVSGPNSTIPIEPRNQQGVVTMQDIQLSKELREYREAFQNQGQITDPDIVERKRSTELTAKFEQK